MKPESLFDPGWASRALARPRGARLALAWVALAWLSLAWLAACGNAKAPTFHPAGALPSAHGQAANQGLVRFPFPSDVRFEFDSALPSDPARPPLLSRTRTSSSPTTTRSIHKARTIVTAATSRTAWCWPLYRKPWRVKRPRTRALPGRSV